MSFNSFSKEMLPIRSGGWIGGDGAYTIALDQESRLWLFGDTWIGNHNGVKRFGAKMIPNSIGIETRRDDKRHFDYFWGNNKKGFFITSNPSEWYWPLDGIVVEGHLYVFLNKLIKTDSSSSFGFKTVGQSLAKIKMNGNSPGNWDLKYLDLPHLPFILGAAVAIEDEFLYVMASKHNKDHEMILARIAISNLKDEKLSFEYLRKDDSWNLAPSEAKTLFNGSPELSLRFDKKSNLWVSIYSPLGMSKYIVKRTVKKITGAWGVPKTIFQCNEMEFSENYYCYEGKQIAPLSDNDPFEISYLVNSFDFWDVARDLRIYIPNIVTE